MAWFGCLHDDNFSGKLLNLSLFYVCVGIGQVFFVLFCCIVFAFNLKNKTASLSQRRSFRLRRVFLYKTIFKKIFQFSSLFYSYDSRD